MNFNIYFIIVAIILVFFIFKFWGDSVSIFLILICFQGFFAYYGKGIENTYKIFIALYALYLFFKYKLNTESRKADRNLMLAFFFFTISYFFSAIIKKSLCCGITDWMISPQENNSWFCLKNFKGIFIYDGRIKNEPKVMVAKDGEIHMSEGLNTNLYLKEGYVHIAKGNSTTELFFDKYNMILRLESDLPSKKNTELTPFELIKEIKERSQHDLSLQLELHRRLSLPLLCLILTFLGPPLSLMAGKAGRLGGLSLGLGVFTIYYVLLIYGENLVKAGKISHYIGAWIPTIIIGLLGLYLFRRASNR